MVVGVTFTETVQVAFAATLPPDSVTEDAPADPVAVPPQVLVRFGVAATTSPAGRLSVNAKPFKAVVWLGLVIVNVRLVVPFSGTVAAPNAFTTLGGLTTVRLAEDVLPFPASEESIVTLFE